MEIVYSEPYLIKGEPFYMIQSNYPTIGRIAFYVFPENYETTLSNYDVAIFRKKRQPQNVVELAEEVHHHDQREPDTDQVPALYKRAYEAVGRIVKTWDDVQWHKEDMNSADSRKIARIIKDGNE